MVSKYGSLHPHGLWTQAAARSTQGQFTLMREDEYRLIISVILFRLLSGGREFDVESEAVWTEVGRVTDVILMTLQCNTAVADCTATRL